MPSEPDIATSIDDARGVLAPTGVVRASINLGNPVLATGRPERPAGITASLARELGRRLGVDVAFHCFSAAKDSVAAISDGKADIGFLAIDPARPLEFTGPYVLIEGVFVVPSNSPIESIRDVDQPGVRVGVKQGSAYDLFLTRILCHATIRRGSEGVTAYADEGLEAGAGIRQPIETWVAGHPGHRVVEPAFMQIPQAVAIPQGRPASALAWVRKQVEDLVDSPFVADALVAAGQDPTLAAPAVWSQTTDPAPESPRFGTKPQERQPPSG